MNAILNVKFLTKEFTFPVNWVKQYLEEGSDIAERVFFSEEFADYFNDGPPEMDVMLVDDQTIRSRVEFESECGELYSSRSLDKLLQK